MLSKTQSERIESAVSEAESRTTSEIAVCILPSSGEDRGTAAIVGALAFALVIIAGPQIRWGVDPLFWTGLGIVAAIVVFWLCDRFDLGLRCLPARLLVKDARRAARAVFLDHALDDSAERNAVLLFVSHAERYVEILPDRAAAAAIPAAEWAVIVDEFRQHMRRADVGEAIAEAATRIGAVCAIHFPVSGANPDRVPNRPIETQG
ncbi:MAG TPA: TPM domain-containing protein [Dongiaceae bacterium]|nr:TPM domain-containing protein [Dongiaceae bacterium]